MNYQDFGFGQFNRERRKFAGRRFGSDRRSAGERRMQQRRTHLAPVATDRRAGFERRGGLDRRAGERRGLLDRRDAAWTMLEGS
jgi:hypothetical protein